MCASYRHLFASHRDHIFTFLFKFSVFREIVKVKYRNAHLSEQNSVNVPFICKKRNASEILYNFSDAKMKLAYALIGIFELI